MTLPEVLTAALVGAIIMTITVALIRPAATASDAEAVQTDLVHSTDEALYRIQRDIRQSDPNGVFICTGAAPPSTCTLGSSLTGVTQTQYLVVLTAHIGGDGLMNWDTNGRPAWTGFDVYWLEPDATGGANMLNYCFAPAAIQPGTDPVILNADVVNAVSVAMSSSDAEAIAHSVESIETFTDVAKDSIAVRIQSQSDENGSTDSTKVEADTYARN